MKRRIAGILIIVLSVGALGFWETWGRENLSYHKIAVLKESIEADTEITQEMLLPKKVESTTEGAISWDRASELIGMESRHFVAGDLELHREYFREPEFKVGKKYDRYILMIPEPWLMSYPESIKRGDKAFFYLGEKRVISCSVAHVKDSYGQEIVYSDLKRYHPSGTIKSIEVIVSSSQMEKLNRLFKKGNRFTLIYTEND